MKTAVKLRHKTIDMKKQLIWLFAAVFMMTIVSCGSSETETDEPTTIGAAPDLEGAEGTASVSLDWAGTYEGVVPCADCSGIQTTLVLSADKSYNLTVSYLGKGDGKPTSVHGGWSWKTGNIVMLNGENFGPDQFFVSEGYVEQLDLEGNKITGDLADKYILKKK